MSTAVSDRAGRLLKHHSLGILNFRRNKDVFLSQHKQLIPILSLMIHLISLIFSPCHVPHKPFSV